MTTEELDKYFTDNFEHLNRTASKIFEYSKGKGSVDDLVQESYLELRRILHKLTVENAEGMFVQFCRSQLGWKNSNHNLTVSHKSPVPFERYSREYKNSSETSENATDEKVLIEQWYTERKIAISIFKKQKKHNQLIADLYIDTNGSNAQMAERLQISRSSVSIMTKEMKQKLKQILKEL